MKKSLVINSPEFSPSRRQFAGLLGGGGVLLLTGCGGGGDGGGGGGGGEDIALPSITIQPQSQTAALGQIVTLRVEAVGQDLSYQWLRNKVAVEGAVNSSLVVTITSADEGAQYAVMVSNAAGQVESQVAVLSLVTIKPDSGMSLLAGGVGGAGLLQGNGAKARLTLPEKLALGKNGVVYFSAYLTTSQYGSVVGKISAQGDVSFIKTLDDLGNQRITCMACDSQGVLYFRTSQSKGDSANTVYKLLEGASPQFVPFVKYTKGQVESMAFDSQDNSYFIDRTNHTVCKATPKGVVSTVATMGLIDPSMLVVLPDDHVLVLDGKFWRKVTPEGEVTTLVGRTPSGIRSIVVLDANSVAVVLGFSIVKLVLTGGQAVIAGEQNKNGYVDASGAEARFRLYMDDVFGIPSFYRSSENWLLALPVDGQLLVADQFNHVIRRIDLVSGQTSTWIGSAPQSGYVDGVGAQARFSENFDIGATCVDKDGDLYVLEREGFLLRKITQQGVVTTLSSKFGSHGGVAVDSRGYFYVVSGSCIKRVSPNGDVELWAGVESFATGWRDGFRGGARFARPQGLVIDAQDNLFVGDAPRVEYVGIDSKRRATYGNTIRKITPEGVVSTIAGIPGRIFEYDLYADPLNIPDPDISFMNPRQLACDAAGNVWVLDSGIRRIDAQSGALVWVVRNEPNERLVPTSLAVTALGTVYFSANIYNATLNQSSTHSNGVSGGVICQVQADGTSKIVVGADDRYRNGVQLGSLPGSLGAVGPIMASPSGNVLYANCENSVLRIQLD